MAGRIRSTTARAPQRAKRVGETETTLLELVSALVATGASDGEVVAAVADLIATGRVRLACGGNSDASEPY